MTKQEIEQYLDQTIRIRYRQKSDEIHSRVGMLIAVTLNKAILALFEPKDANINIEETAEISVNFESIIRVYPIKAIY